MGTFWIEKQKPEFYVVLLSCRKILQERVKLEVSFPIHTDILHHSVDAKGKENPLNDLWVLLLYNTVGFEE